MASASRGPKGPASTRGLQRVLMVGAMVAALGGCAAPGPDDDRGAAQTGAAVAAQQTPAGRVYHAAAGLARPEARLRALLASRPEAWSPAGEQLESLALRGPAGQWLEGVGARAAVRADLPLEIGAGASAEKRVWLTPVDARPAPVAVHEGHLIYEEAYQGTDLVLAAEQERVEVLFVLRHGGAPNRFAWRLTHGAKLPHVRLTDDGEVAFEDAPGHAVLRVPRAFALDAKGTRRDARLDVADGLLSVTLDTTGLEYPVLLDPAFERAVWDNVTPGSGNPGVRGEHGLVFDTNRNVAVLFGGIDGSGNRYGDTWEWNGTGWTQRCATGACGLSARRNFASAFDNNAGRNVMVIFGGNPLGSTVDETWEWNGTAWSQKCTSAPCSTVGNHPSGRTYSSMAYDSTRHVSVLFGGTTNDTWEWNGTTWTLKCADSVCPIPRRNRGAMAFDGNRGVAVYLGGQLGATSLFTNEVWEWNGSVWTQKCTASPCTDLQPSARTYHALAYDSTTQRVVLFGGHDGSNSLADTWQWDGSVWTSLSGTAPTPRNSHALAYDTARKRVTLFGGVNVTYYQDTWNYHSRGRDCSVGGAAICDTGYCAENVCCETACNATCYACDQAGTEGTCTLLPRNAHDAYPTNACVNPKACDGSGGCLDDYGVSCSAGTTCASGKCVDNRCCDTDCLGTCLGCNVSGHLGTCWNLDQYTDDLNATVTCTGTTTCDGSGSCLNENGQTCAGGCASGNCVDSVCCDTTCTTACMGCAVSGHVGTCYNLPRYTEDTYPANACVDGTYQMSCNGSGLCKRDNGQACANGVADCASGNCVDGVCCDTACMGTCLACNLTGHVGTCYNLDRYAHDTNATTTCLSPKACDGSGNCYNENGQACTGGCASGNCVDAVCCDTACTDLCKACNVTSHVGACWNVDRYSTDTDSGCVAPNTCNGGGFCRKANGQPCPSGLGSECASDNCVDTVCCDTACTGTCMSCNVASHVGTCFNLPRYSEDAFPVGACLDGAYKMSCDGSGSCRRDNGQACPGGAGDCASGNCVEGVCCDTTCTATCTSCNVAGSVGTCTNIPRYTEDTYPANACVDGTYKMSCNGGGACRRDNGEACGTDGTLCASGNCVDGVCCDTGCMGTCMACTVTGHVGTCWNLDRYAHDTNATVTCVSPKACDGAGNCFNENGQGCSPGCASGYCVDGVCCSTDCVAVCKACNVSGSEGTCANLPRDAEDTYGSTQCIKAENHACDGNGVCKAKNGVACGTDGTLCASGICVDGVCCNAACSATCTGCNEAGSVGTCTNIAMNGQDSWPAGACVAPMGCDGLGVCRKQNGQPCPNGPSDCASNICVEGVCCNDLCTGMCKSCLVAGSVGTCSNLPQYAHDTYPTDSCIAPNACDGSGNCKGENGQTCGSNPGLCASGNCVDNQCCDTACTTACWACNVAGSEGTCSKLPQNAADSFPGNACVAPNACDGNGVCKLAAGETCSASAQCASGVCIDNVCCAEACDAPCKRCGTGGTCLNIGSGLEDPVASLPCTLPNGSCDGLGHCKRVLGQPCGTGDDCISGNCADSVCCDGPCAGACRSCNQLGFVGTCRMYPASSDPESECGSGPCKGTCDGTVGCTYPGSTVECLAQNCTSGSRHLASKCDGAGGCTPGASNDCSPYECNDAQVDCQTGCLDDGDCQHAFWCDGTHCVADLGLTETCSRDSQCTSDHCVDGVCCNEACTGDCQYCAYAGTKGTCVGVPVGDDPKLKCQAASGGAAECAGACDATGQCAFPETGTACGLCSACDGTGRCTATPADDPGCGTIDCSGLDTTCRTYGDLTASRCASLGTCKEPNDPGTCTQYTDRPCNDGGSGQADGGGSQQQDSGTGPGDKSGGCRVGGQEPVAGVPFLLAALAWVWRRRRRQ